MGGLMVELILLTNSILLILLQPMSIFLLLQSQYLIFLLPRKKHNFRTAATDLVPASVSSPAYGLYYFPDPVSYLVDLRDPAYGLTATELPPSALN